MKITKECWCWLDRQILLFPVVAVVLVALTFLCGGRCSAWQWWTAIVVVGMLPFCRREVKMALTTNGLFAIFLAILWLLVGVVASNGCIDIRTYHMPAIRMLMEGWNPVRDSTPEAFADALGVSLNELWPCHVIAMTKSVWYFSAVAQFFVKDPLNVLFPLLIPILFSTVATGYEFFREQSLAVRTLISIAILVATPTFTTTIVDTTVGLAGIGLIMTMGEYLRTRKWRWCRLIVFSFWMCTSKHLGMESCFIFWCVFALAVMRSKIEFVRCFTVASALVALIVIVCASPYLTSWKNYGHPLYPAYTGDSKNYPAHSITSDFLDRNEDAAALGRTGAFVNAYVCPSVVRHFYRHKLGKPNFFPVARVWRHTTQQDSGSPTTASTKIMFCISVALILIVGDKVGRLLALMPILAMAAVPAEMIGYIRYCPWFAVIAILAFEALLRQRRGWLQTVGKVTFAAFPVSVFAGIWLLHNAIRVDARLALEETIFTQRQDRLYVQAGEFEKSIANMKLLCRQVPQWKYAKVQVADDPSLSGLVPMPGCDCLAEKTGVVASEFSAVQKESHVRRLCEYPLHVLKAYFYGMPKLMAGRVCSLIR